jgi:hypothetical protein
MSDPRFPRPRRRKELLKELVARAQVWLPEWQPRRGSKDFAQAVFEIAARLGSEVTQRLDRVPEKSLRGFMQWLGVGGAAARAARLPLVFGMTPGSEPVDAEARVQLQALLDPPVTLETEKALRIIPGRLGSLVAADPGSNRFFVAPPRPLEAQAPRPLPDEWSVIAFGDNGEVQFAQSIGIEPGLVVLDSGKAQHEVTKVDKGIVTLSPPLAPSPSGRRVTRAVAFDAFDGSQIDRQKHALYIGADHALDVSTPAVIEVASQGVLALDAVWEYWGKAEDASAEPTWHEFVEPVRQDGRLLLVKGEGTIEPYEVAGRTQRWLRVRPQSNLSMTPGEAAAIALTINCRPAGKAWPATWPAGATARLDDALGAAPAKIGREAIANTAPLVLDQPFYPLGREPRLFDAFYLGSKEVFSKPAARATVRFEIGDQFGGALAAIKVADAHLVVAIGNDGRLQRLRVPDATRVPVFEQGTQPAGEGGKPIALQAGMRPGAASFGGKAYVSALEAGGPGEQPIWLLVQPAPQPASEWQSLGIPPTHGPDHGCTDTLLVNVASLGLLRVYAVAGQRLHRREASSASTWLEVDLSDRGQAVAVAKVVAVQRLDGAAGEQEEADGLLCVSADGELFHWDGTDWEKIDWTGRLDPTVYPLAVRFPAGDVLCVARLQLDTDGRPGPLIALRLQAPEEAQEIDAKLVGDAFGFTASAGVGDPAVIVLFVTEQAGEKRPARWQPFPDNDLTVADAPSGGKAVIGAPVAIGSAHVVPAENGTVYISAFNPQLWQSVEAATVTDGVIFAGHLGSVNAAELLIDITVSHPVNKTLVKADSLVALPKGMQLLILEKRLEHPVTSIGIYRLLHSDVRSGHLLEPTRLQLQDDDDDVEPGVALHIDSADATRVHLVQDVEPATETTSAVAVLKRALPKSTGSVIAYRSTSPLGTFDSEAKPVVDVDQLRPAVLAALANGRMYFPAMLPHVQVPLHVLADVVVLSERWDRPPDAATTRFAFIADAGSTDWLPYGPAKPRNPELSWEYWNGSGWWQIKGVKDETANLVNSGAVTFCVPADLKPADVVGRANHWVRARLVGGDYGQESVTIESTRVPATSTSPETTTQKIVRSADSIRAPFVVSMTLAYEVCCPVAPEVVLAEDSAAFVDLSGANRTPGAKVPHFIPLSRSLADLNRAAGASTPPDPAAEPDGGKALYLGFDAPLQGESISVLFLVTEGDHAGAYPLQLEVLRRNGFESVVVEDNTRGLNESGTLSFALSEPPLFSQLFGASASGYWLRVRPNARFNAADWRPVIRGAWLNGTWAAAAETRLLELLGSSDGSPRQSVVLAQPPVILDSLELRVRERLGEEDKDMLRRSDPDAVEEQLGPRVGPWVRWTLKGDTDDAGPDERVYSLDEETGEIAFGDGQHGKIPPIGADAILARSYRHGGGLATNRVAAWSQINLVTPLAGVDSVVAPDGAAGGTGPQDAATTIRFAPNNVFVRDRALTLHDIEVLALQFSPDIAQVSARSVPPGVRVVVVMRGRAPNPSAAVCRELRSFLLGRAPPALAADGALAIVGPKLLLLNVSLQLVIDRIEHSGAVSAEAERRVRALLDPASGGLDQTGWPLGRAPSQDEIVAQLVDMRHLAEVGDVSLHAVSPDGELAEVPDRLAPGQLAQVTADGVRCDLRLPESEITE